MRERIQGGCEECIPLPRQAIFNNVFVESRYNTKLVNNVAYKSFIIKSISVNEPSSVPTQYKRATYFYINSK